MKLVLALLIFGLAGIGYAQSPREPLYLADVSRAMATMMADMTVEPTGDVDADFVAAMIPHHQGAIAMAQAELTFGQNELLRRIAQGIVVEQAQEIEAMRVALRERPGRAASDTAAPSAVAPGEHRHAR